jgi:hypothetical protein
MLARLQSIGFQPVGDTRRMRMLHGQRKGTANNRSNVTVKTRRAAKSNTPTRPTTATSAKPKLPFSTTRKNTCNASNQSTAASAFPYGMDSMRARAPRTPHHRIQKMWANGTFFPFPALHSSGIACIPLRAKSACKNGTSDRRLRGPSHIAVN